MPTTDHLAELKLSLSDIQGLSREQQCTLFRKKFYLLAHIHHPDKNPHNPLAEQIFKKIVDAYDELNKSLNIEQQAYRSDIELYFPRENINIPDTAFDLLLHESIENAYEELKKSFLALESEHAKKAFALHYAPFINLALSLSERTREFHHNRANYLFAQQNEPLKARLRRKWRVAIIRLFGEEYLDDFQYRQASVGGDLLPILATRKLLSPVKYIAAVINGINILVCSSVFYLVNPLAQKVTADFINEYYKYQQGTLRLNNVCKVVLEVVGYLALLIIPYYMAPTLFLLGLGLPMVSALVELIACPVNQLIRPLAAYTGFSPVMLSAVGFITGAAIAYSAIGVLAVADVSLAFLCLTLPLSLYSLYATAKLVKNLYHINPALGVFQAAMIVGSLFSPSVAIDLESTVNVLALLFANLTNCSILYNINNILENQESAQIAEIEVLPLPEEPVSESIQTATLLGTKKAIQSSRFFNTSNNAEYLKNDERSLWQQSCSFFGDGGKASSETVLPVVSNPAVLAIAA